MKILGALVARMSSRRLPGKVLQPIMGRSMLEFQLERFKRAESPDKIIFATSTDPSDDAIEDSATSLGVDCHRGALDDVLDRLTEAGRAQGAEHIIRVGGDCPLMDWQIIDRVVALHIEDGNDFTSNIYPPTFPDGMDVEVYSMDFMERLWTETSLPSERELISPNIAAKSGRYRIGNLARSPDLSHLRLTVDEIDDLEVVCKIYTALYPANPAFTLEDIIEFMEADPTIGAINARFARNEGAAAVYQKDRLRRGD